MGDQAETEDLANDFAEFFEAELSAGLIQETAQSDGWKKQERPDCEEEDEEDELDFLFEAQQKQLLQPDTTSESAQHPVEDVVLPGSTLASEPTESDDMKVVALLEHDGPSASKRPFLRYAWRDGGLWLQASESLGAPTVELLRTAAHSADFLHLRLGGDGPDRIELRLPAPFQIDGELDASVVSLEVEEDEHPAWHVRVCTSDHVAPACTDVAEVLALQRLELAESLNARGWGLIDGFLRGAEADDVHLFMRNWWATGKLEPWKKKVVCDEYVYMDTRGVVAPAGTGWRGDVFTQGGPLPPGLQPVQERLGRLVQDLGMSLPQLGGMLEVENPMLATFPGGGTRYARHFDSAGSTRRVCTAILYLNPFWRRGHGGQLRIFPELPGGGGDAFVELGATPEGERTATLDPLHGRLVVFLCDERNAHEVLASWRPRMAITWWIRRMKVGPG